MYTLLYSIVHWKSILRTPFAFCFVFITILYVLWIFIYMYLGLMQAHHVIQAERHLIAIRNLILGDHRRRQTLERRELHHRYRVVRIRRDQRAGPHIIAVRLIDVRTGVEEHAHQLALETTNECERVTTGPATCS